VSVRPRHQSRSNHNVLRGLHYQIQQPQGKLVRTIAGAIFDVAVDLRTSAPTFGQSVATTSALKTNANSDTPGFAHGFLVLSDLAEVLYKTTDYYAPQHERCISLERPDLAIDWPLSAAPPIVSAKIKPVNRSKQLKSFHDTHPPDWLHRPARSRIATDPHPKRKYCCWTPHIDLAQPNTYPIDRELQPQIIIMQLLIPL